MLIKGKTIVVNGSSVISEKGTEKVIATMNVNIDEDGGISRSTYINSRADYLANKETADADIKEFEAYVDSLVEV